MIEESYVLFETAQMLKETGFREPCASHYSNSGQVWQSSSPEDYNDDKSCQSCSRPTAQLAARWLRERHGLHVEPSFFGAQWFYSVWHLASGRAAKVDYSLRTSYEEALEAGLVAALRLISGMDKPEQPPYAANRNIPKSQELE